VAMGGLNQASEATTPPPAPVERRLLLTPKHPWEAQGVFNPAVLPLKNHRYALFYRGEAREVHPGTGREEPISRLGYAEYCDRRKQVLKHSPTPWLSPKGIFLKRFPNGFCDPRLTELEGERLLVLNGYNKHEAGDNWRARPIHEPLKGVAHILLFRLGKGLTRPQFEGKIGPEEFNKNSFFHPERLSVNGRPHYLLFHRLKTDIQYALAPSLASFKSPHFWQQETAQREARTFLKAVFPWEGRLADDPKWPGQVAGAAAPVPVYVSRDHQRLTSPKDPQGEKLWLFFYNASGARVPGTSYTEGRTVGASLLRIEGSESNAVRTVARAPEPILRADPKQPFKGGKADTVFATGVAPTRDGQHVTVFYGEGDYAVGMAKFKLAALTHYLLQFDDLGRRLSAQASVAKRAADNP
jgi:predicted GH43/DUF377 family glycosyl hydrolase